MQFSFDEEQREFAEMVREYLEQSFQPADLRGQWEDGGNANRDLIAPLADLGVMGATIPEQLGGLERDGMDMPLAIEAFGYFGVSELVGLTSGAIAPFLVKHASAALHERWLPKIAEGKAIGSVQLDADSLVLGATVADIFLVVRDSQVYLVASEHAIAVPADAQDHTLALGSLSVSLEAAEWVAGGDEAVAYLTALTRAAVASHLVGLAQRMLDMTRDYMLVREQFGRVIGSFQSLKHRMADCAVQIEAARSLSWAAHYSHVHDYQDAMAAAAMAKSAASSAAHRMNYAALQHHGGNGFTWEFDLHLWLQRGFALERIFGTADQLRAELGARYLGQGRG